MKQTLILLAATAAILYLVRNAKPAGTDLGNGWKLLPNGIDAGGPNGEQAKYTGVASGDPYPSPGQFGVTIF